MISLKQKSKGFTIVELLIVIVVIGILATLVIVTFTGIQRKARNSQRQTDINAVDSHLEAYYAEEGHYPSLKDLQSPSWVHDNLQGLDPEALVDPDGSKTATTTGISGTAGDDTYGYSVNQGDEDKSSCEDDDKGCATFTLTANLEGGDTYVKQSNT